MWVTRVSSLVQESMAFPAYHGLGALICSTAENLNHGACIIHSYMISPSSLSLSLSPSSSSVSLSSSLSSPSSSSSLFLSLSHSSSWSSTMDDLIGTESGVMSSNEDTVIEELQKTKPYTFSTRSRSKPNQRCEIKREYPPPIASLARVPRVLTRNCINGRLILRQDRVQRYEYMEAKRENGRLLLNIIPVYNENDDEDVKLGNPYMSEDLDDKEVVDDFNEDGCCNHVKDIDFQDSNIGDGNETQLNSTKCCPNYLSSASFMPESCHEIGNKEDLQKCLFYAGLGFRQPRLNIKCPSKEENHFPTLCVRQRAPNQFQVILLLSAVLLQLTMADGHETDKNIEIWKIKKLIKALEAARGNGTSMISLIMPPRDQISRVTKMLGDEFGTASNIKSRVNRQSVLGAITSAQQRLKLYNKVPPNGLVLYTGTIVTEDGKEKKVTIDFEPFRPINASLYLCDNKFHTEALNELLESDDKFGFIVMDGNGTLFGTLSGNTREVLHKFTVDLPKKHGRGGQSALRFARLRMEKRHNYVRKTAELATQFFINPATSQPNVAGLILAGSADFKTELSQSDMFDPRLQAKILNVVDVSYGGENGFNQAIELSSEILSNVKFIQEKRLIGKYFEEISQDTGKYVFGVDDTLKALEMGAVETLIVWENLDINRYVLKNSSTGEIVIKHLNKDQEADQNNFRDSATSAELEVQEKLTLLEWFANEYKRFGCTLEFVTNKSQEGSQFCRGRWGKSVHQYANSCAFCYSSVDNQEVSRRVLIRIFRM
ncbi:hypothetical protein F0562_027389 [Nyssa sinensis]|uniref:eRF1/Pelota-like N-terminal domain-containing protein n=1 Tax=Nyssa sinensis TaxID=561372 RepID=A0A5J5BA06_9ASTE|nr:hypothetical protein F0562_027389 [Nyssa sinensis]